MIKFLQLCDKGSSCQFTGSCSNCLKYLPILDSLRRSGAKTPEIFAQSGLYKAVSCWVPKKHLCKLISGKRRWQKANDSSLQSEVWFAASDRWCWGYSTPILSSVHRSSGKEWQSSWKPILSKDGHTLVSCFIFDSETGLIYQEKIWIWVKNYQCPKMDAFHIFL